MRRDWVAPRAAVVVTVWGLGATTALATVACGGDPGYQGRPSQSWIAQLDAGPTRDARADAAMALGHVLDVQPNTPAVVTALVRALADTNDIVRVAAAFALTGAAASGGQTRAALPGAVPGLATLLADTAHADVRVQAARVLGGLGTATGAGGVRLVAGALRDPDADVRRASLDAVAQIGPSARAGWPALDTALVRLAREDTVAANRQAALAALTAIHAPAALLRPALVRAAADPDRDTRKAAVTTLGLLGAAADPAARAGLTRALADADAGVRQEARHALSGFHRQGGIDPTRPEP